MNIEFQYSKNCTVKLLCICDDDCKKKKTRKKNYCYYLLLPFKNFPAYCFHLSWMIHAQAYTHKTHSQQYSTITESNKRASNYIKKEQHKQMAICREKVKFKSNIYTTKSRISKKKKKRSNKKNYYINIDES